MFEGYLKEQAVGKSFGSTVHLTNKALSWMNLAKCEENISLKLLPSQSLLTQLRSSVKYPVLLKTRCQSLLYLPVCFAGLKYLVFFMNRCCHMLFISVCGLLV